MTMDSDHSNLERRLLETLRLSSFLRLSSLQQQQQATPAPKLSYSEWIDLLNSDGFVNLVEKISRETLSASAALTNQASVSSESLALHSKTLAFAVNAAETLVVHLSLARPPAPEQQQYRFAWIDCISRCVLTLGTELQKIHKDPKLSALADLAKNGIAVLKVFIAFLDERVLPTANLPAGASSGSQGSGNEADVLSLEVCSSLLEVCIQTEKDYALLNLSWKYLVKLATKFTDASVSSRIPVLSILDVLYDLSLGKFIDSFADIPGESSKDSDAFARTSKVAQFYLTHLCNLVRCFASRLRDHYAKLAGCVVTMKGIYFVTLAATKISLSTFEVASKTATYADAIVKYLAQDVEFILELVQLASVADTLPRIPPKAVNPQHIRVAKLMAVLYIASIFFELPAAVVSGLLPPPDRSEAGELVQSRSTMLDIVFACVEECKSEFLQSLRLVSLSKTESERLHSISLYQHTCVSLCSFVAAFPPDAFAILELFLVKQVLSPSCLSTLLATDLWCFVCKVADVSVALLHLRLLGMMICCLPRDTSQFLRLASTIARLSAAVPMERLLALTGDFDPSENYALLSFWSSCGFGKEDPASASAFASKILPHALRVLPEGLSLLGLPQEVTLQIALDTLRNAAKSPLILASISSQARPVAQDLIRVLAGALARLSAISTRTLCLLLETLAALVPLLTAADVLQVLKGCSAGYASLPLAAKHSLSVFLGKCGLFRSEDRPRVEELFRLWARLFQLLLRDANWVLRNRALADLGTFAAFTEYGHIVASLPPPESTDAVRDYLQRIPHSQEQFAVETARFAAESDHWAGVAAVMTRRESEEAEQFRGALDAFQRGFDSLSLTEKRKWEADGRRDDERLKRSTLSPSMAATMDESSGRQHFVEAIQTAKDVIERISASMARSGDPVPLWLSQELLSLQETVSRALQ